MEEIKEIRNNIVNGIFPTGNVDIKVFRGTKKIRDINGHNTGTIDLCKFLRDSLTGSNVISYRPGRIVPCTRVGSDLVDMFTYGVQYLPESISNKGNDSDSAWLDMGFIIPNTVLQVGQKIEGFRLYRNILADDGSMVKYAEIDFSKQIDPSTGTFIKPIEITNGNTSIRVDWRLKISISEA